MLNINSFKFTLVLVVLFMLSTAAAVATRFGTLWPSLQDFNIGSFAVNFVMGNTLRALAGAAIMWIFLRKKLTFPAIWNMAIIALLVSQIIGDIVGLFFLFFTGTLPSR